MITRLLLTQLKKVIIFRNIFTYLFTSLFLVKKFFKHIDKDMITRLFLTQLEKVIIFRHTFFLIHGESQLTFLTQLEKVIIFRHTCSWFTGVPTGLLDV